MTDLCPSTCSSRGNTVSTKMPASIDHRKQAKSLGDSAVVKGYLIAYNVSQMLGWIILMFMIVCHIYREGNVTLLYKEVEQVLLIFQTAAVLEIVHSSLGLVKSNPILTTFQVFSRVFLLWGVVWSVPQVQTEVYVFYFLIAWTITEIIRYSFYFFSLLGGVPYTLKWCRYTLFIALYPVGVMGEVMTIYSALPYVKASGLYSLFLPNPANMSFNYFYYLWFILFSYIPVFPQLYGHMLSQRRKVICGGQHAKQE